MILNTVLCGQAGRLTAQRMSGLQIYSSVRSLSCNEAALRNSDRLMRLRGEC
jgi:hypothetical protein